MPPFVNPNYRAGIGAKRLPSVLLALAAATGAVATLVATLYLATYRVDDYCEDAGGPCTDAAPVRVALLAITAVVALVALGRLAVRALRLAEEPRAQELRRPLLRALAAVAAWLVVAASLFID